MTYIEEYKEGNKFFGINLSRFLRRKQERLIIRCCCRTKRGLLMPRSGN